MGHHAQAEKDAKLIHQKLLNIKAAYPYVRGDHVSLLPFRMFLLREMRMTGISIHEIANAIHRNENMVRRWVEAYYWEGECTPHPVHSIDLGSVDDVLTALGYSPDTLNDLYPYVERRKK